MGHPVTSNQKIPNSAKNSDSKQQVTLKTPDTGIIMRSYIPYLIAGSFIVMTALLTLLLTIVMDNKAELDQVLAEQGYAPETMLVDAREAFGQDEPPVAKEPDAPALLQEEIAISPTLNEQTADTQVGSEGETPATVTEPNTSVLATANSTIDTPAEVVDEKTTAASPTPNTPLPAITESVANIPADSEDKTVATSPTPHKPVAAITVSANDANKAVAIVENQDSTTNADPSTITNALSVSKPLPIEDEQVASAGHDLDRVVDAHETRINDIRAMITLRDTNKRQVEQAITYHLNLMEMQVRYIEDRIRPAFPPAIASFERMVNRRREAFHRRMRHREELRQRIYESRNFLRREYTQLLELLRDKNLSIA
jgi:hypothetical protein